MKDVEIVSHKHDLVSILIETIDQFFENEFEIQLGGFRSNPDLPETCQRLHRQELRTYAVSLVFIVFSFWLAFPGGRCTLMPSKGLQRLHQLSVLLLVWGDHVFHAQGPISGCVSSSSRRCLCWLASHRLLR
jgi:hypothetical protein